MTGDTTIGGAPPAAPRALLIARLGIGLAQGLALLALSRLLGDEGPHPWAAANPKGFGLLVLLATLLPLPVLLGLGHMRGRVLAGWGLAAAGLILVLGLQELRRDGAVSMTPAGNLLLLSLGAILFVGQSLVAAAEGGRRWPPRYPDLFEAAWRTGLQLVLGACFVLGFWLVYWIASMLFSGIGLEGLSRLGGRLSFVIPVTALLGAAAIHRLDAGWRLTLGVRTLVLALKAWLTPLAAAFAAAFLLSLPFTGLAVLLRRGDAPSWLLAAAAGLVVLINAVHGDGREAPPRLLRLSARLAAFLLPVLVLLAGWGLTRIVAAYGLTETRVIGAAVLALTAAYGLAYPVAALRPGMRGMEPANVAIALLALPVLAALNTPLANPVALEVRSQTGRLLRGEVAPGRFDFYRLERSGRDGRRALAELARNPDPAIAGRAVAALPAPEGEAQAAEEASALPRLRAAPAGTALPPGLVEAMREAGPECLAEECVARPIRLEEEEAWLVGPVGIGFWVMRAEGAGWRRAATYSAPYHCRAGVVAGLLDGPPRVRPPALPELETGGVVLRPAASGTDCR